MPIISSQHWITALDVCAKHHCHLPCDKCLGAHDKNIRVELEGSVNEKSHTRNA